MVPPRCPEFSSQTLIKFNKTIILHKIDTYIFKLLLSSNLGVIVRLDLE